MLILIFFQISLAFQYLDLKLRCIITFVSDEWGSEYLHLYTADDFDGDLAVAMENCNEGVLKWVPKKDIFDLSLWEGDKIFLKMLLETENIFSLKLEYQGDELVKWSCREW